MTSLISLASEGKKTTQKDHDERTARRHHKHKSSMKLLDPFWSFEENWSWSTRTNTKHFQWPSSNCITNKQIMSQPAQNLNRISMHKKQKTIHPTWSFQRLSPNNAALSSNKWISLKPDMVNDHSRSLLHIHEQLAHHAGRSEQQEEHTHTNLRSSNGRSWDMGHLWSSRRIDITVVWHAAIWSITSVEQAETTHSVLLFRNTKTRRYTSVHQSIIWPHRIHNPHDRTRHQARSETQSSRHWTAVSSGKTHREQRIWSPDHFTAMHHVVESTSQRTRT